MQETIQAQSSLREFPWLIDLVKSKLFYEYCDQHGKLRRSFCCVCMIPPLCDECYKENEHRDHLMIHVIILSFYIFMPNDYY